MGLSPWVRVVKETTSIPEMRKEIRCQYYKSPTPRRICSSRALTGSYRVPSGRFGAASRSAAGLCRSGPLPFALRCISGTHDGPLGLAGAGAFLTLRAEGCLTAKTAVLEGGGPGFQLAPCARPPAKAPSIEKSCIGPVRVATLDLSALPCQPTGHQLHVGRASAAASRATRSRHCPVPSSPDLPGCGGRRCLSSRPRFRPTPLRRHDSLGGTAA